MLVGVSGESAAVRPVFARHASSLVLWRRGPAGLEVLMGLRGATARFVPNRLVFPGGAVEERDKRAPAAREPDPGTLAMLGRAARPLLARGLVMAAARELEEETGVGFGAPPRLDSLRYLCRAVTPPRMGIRFNARFLAAPADAAEGQPRDSAELSLVRFYPVEEALGLGLMQVTAEVLRRLQEFVAAPDAERELFTFERERWVRERRR